MSIKLLLATAVLAVIFLSGCSWVDLKPEGQNVRLLTESDVKRCKKIGHVTSHTLYEVAYVPRDDESVNEELLRLSRNYAGEMGGNAIVPTGPAKAGEQSFLVYYCSNR